MASVQKSKQRQTAERLVAAYAAMDTETIIALRSPECLRTILPSSQGYKQQDNETFGRLLEQLKHIFHDFSLDVLDIIEDIPQRKIVLFLRAHGNTDVGEYVNEYVWRLCFDQAGEVIENWWEFTDASMKGFFGQLQGAMKAREEAAKLAAEPAPNGK